MRVILIGLLASGAAEASEPTNWWSNGTEVVNVAEFFEEELRLAQGFHDGYAAGFVPVPEGGLWDVRVSIRTDESFDAPEEYVDIVINDEFIDRAHNTPPGEIFEYVIPIETGLMSYRFEFYSPVTFFSGHLVVEAASLEPRACTPDLNRDGSLDVLDFIAFQGEFQSKSPGADCDASGALNVLDFICFQDLFLAGCE